MKLASYLILLVLPFMNACYFTESADLLIHNATIYTVDANFSVQEAMAIKDGKIIDIGSNNELKNRYESKEIIDAENKIIYPGFIDAHCHFVWYGHTFNEVNLVGTKSWDEVIERVKAFAEKSKNEWIIGRGWDQNDWNIKEFPNNQQLSKLFPDKAVLLTRIDFHAAIANQKALELSNINNSSSIEGGVYQKENNQLTGLLIDNAIASVEENIPPLTKSQIKSALLKAQEMCFEKGLTSVADAYLENKMVHAIDTLHRTGELKMNIYGMLKPSTENKDEFLVNGIYLTEKLSIRSFKFFADGALGSRGALLLEPYHDHPENKGISTLDSLTFLEEAKEMHNKGFQVNTHCIGDGANRMVLNIYGQILKTTNDKRWRIEHAQIVNDKDLDQFKKFTIIPSVQPTHAISDMDWAEDRLGSERMQTAYAYQDLLQTNGILPLGTDFPIEDIDPLKTFHAATIRKNAEGEPKKGFQAENAISREEALKGMTIWAAIANFEEQQRGSLEVGKNADFILVNQDLMKVKEEKILSTKVISTFIDGEKVYQKTTP